jgi:ATP-dependent DNA ligase
VHEIKHDGYRLMARRDALSVGIRPKMEKRPTLRPTGLLLFARFR